MHAIDAEVRKFIDTNYDRAETILKEHMDKLHAMAEALIKYETIDEDQIKDIMAGREPREPQDWDEDGPASPAGSQRPKDDPTNIGEPAGQH